MCIIILVKRLLFLTFWLCPVVYVNISNNLSHATFEYKQLM